MLFGLAIVVALTLAGLLIMRQLLKDNSAERCVSGADECNSMDSRFPVRANEFILTLPS